MSQIVWSNYLQANRWWGVKLLLAPLYYLLVLENYAGLPNLLTVLRFFMGILFFFILSHSLFDLALIVLVIATATDYFDGYLARKRGLTSDFGRIADPLVDKLIICGGFIVLILYTQTVMATWMVVLIVVREVVIGVLRGYAEFRGIKFPGSTAGKWKMAGQCASLCSLLLYAGHFNGVLWARLWVDFALWFTVVITAYSGLLYLYGAVLTLRNHTGHAATDNR